MLSSSVHGFENVAALADDLGLRWVNKGHADAGAEQLQGDFLTVAEFHAVAIGAMFEPRENNVFLVLDAKARLQIARYAFELEVACRIERRLRSCNRRVPRDRCFPKESGWSHISRTRVQAGRRTFQANSHTFVSLLMSRDGCIPFRS